MVCFRGYITVVGLLQSAAVLGLCTVLVGVYSAGKVWICYHPIGMNCFFFHVKFEGELSVSVLGNRATLYKKVGMKTSKFRKKS
jgi:hypothetical protein